MKQLKTLAIVALVVVAGLAVGRSIETQAFIMPWCIFGKCRQATPKPQPPAAPSPSTSESCIQKKEACIKHCGEVYSACLNNAKSKLDKDLCEIKNTGCRTNEFNGCEAEYKKCHEEEKK